LTGKEKEIIHEPGNPNKHELLFNPH